ncbi:MAG: substrate-binding domain-containing protein [Terriglobia bacterium]
MRHWAAKPPWAEIPEVALLLETSTEYGRGLLRGILKYVRLHGPWTLSVAPGHLDQSLAAAASWEGTGIIARVRTREMAEWVRSTRLPLVVSSLLESQPLLLNGRYGEIRTDSEAIGRMGAKHLLDAGLRNFAFCGFANHQWSAARAQAFTRMVTEAGYECSVLQVGAANWMKRPNWIKSWAHDRPILADWLRSLPKPVGLMGANDACGREVLQVCTAERIQAPDQVAVVGVDNDEMMCELSTPPLSSVSLDLDEAGYEAARLLDALMRRQTVSERVVRVEPTHVVHRRSSDVIIQEDEAVGRALRYIRERARQPVSVSEVAAALGISRRSLERRFLAALGRTVLDEITRCHLARARQLLVETDLPCYQIAADSGFGSLRSFNRAFSEKEGLTPLRFRQHSTVTSSAPSTG